MAVREGLLALLVDGPRHGYQLKTDFENATAGVWRLNVGQVYTTLERLERDGMVTGTPPDAEGRRIFTITTAGERELAHYLAGTSAEDAPAREGLMLKVLVAVSAEGVDALAVIHAERTSRMAALQARRRGARDAGLNGALAPRLALDALVSQTESELRWLEVCEERILAARRAHTRDEEHR